MIFFLSFFLFEQASYAIQPALPEIFQNTDGQRLTLRDCIRIGITSTSDVLKAQNQTTVTGSALQQAYAQFLPNVSTQSNYSFQKGNSYFTLANPTFVSSQGTGISYSVSSNLNLFNGFSDYSQFQASHLREDASHLSLDRVKQQMIFDITQSFYQVILDKEVVKIHEQNLKLSRERLTLLEEQTKLGLKNLSDLFRQQARESQDEVHFLQAQNRLRNDQILLLKKLRLDLSDRYQLEAVPFFEQVTENKQYQDEGEMLRLAVEQRFDLKAAHHASRASSFDLTQARGAYYPKLELGLSALSNGKSLQRQFVQGQNVLPFSQQTIWDQLGSQISYTATLTLSWNLFDRWTTRLSTAKAEVTSKNLEIEARDRELQIQAEVRQAYGDYQAASLSLVATRKGVEAAQKAFEVTQGRYEVGSASIVDVLSAQVAFIEASFRLAQAQTAFTLQGTAMEFVLGTLSES